MLDSSPGRRDEEQVDRLLGCVLGRDFDHRAIVYESGVEGREGVVLRAGMAAEVTGQLRGAGRSRLFFRQCLGPQRFGERRDADACFITW